MYIMWTVRVHIMVALLLHKNKTDFEINSFVHRRESINLGNDSDCHSLMLYTYKT